MSIKINLHATYRYIAGEKVVIFDALDGLAVSELLRVLGNRYPPLQGEFFRGGVLRKEVHIFVNRRDVLYQSEGLATLLHAGDVVDLFPAISGG